MGAIEIVIVLASIVVVTGVLVVAIYRKKKRPTSCGGVSCANCPYACKASCNIKTKSNEASLPTKTKNR